MWAQSQAIDFELIDAKRQALCLQAALIARRQSMSKLIRLAGDLDGRFHAKAVGIGHFKVQFAAIALAIERHRTE